MDAREDRSVRDMEKNKHMDINERSDIQTMLTAGCSFAAIARSIGRDKTTVSKEVKKHRTSRKSGALGNKFNNCANRFTCKHENDACPACNTRRLRKCRTCSSCLTSCSDFIEEKCRLLERPPYVCNGCDRLRKCTLEKSYYYALTAQKAYDETLSESRKGVVITEGEICSLNSLLVPLIRNQGQSVHHIFISHKDEIMMSEKKLYKLINDGILEVRNIDLPVKVKRRTRRKSSSAYKVDKKCLEGRRYEDFKDFIAVHPDTMVVQMDSVEGRKGESCLLTIHFTTSSFMIAIKRKTNDSRSVTDFFDSLYDDLGAEQFRKLFPVILTDNGSEFSNPSAIEFDAEGNRRTRIFYCHPSSPYEKGDCENNHEFIRRIIPKGTSMDGFDQAAIDLMMSHINSYAREKLNDRSPYDMFSFMFGTDVTRYFGIERVLPDDITLKPSLLKKAE